MNSLTSRCGLLLRMAFSAKFVYIYAGLRRRGIFYLRPGYFKRQMGLRKGSCNQEGACCKLTIPWCPHLEGSACRIYDNQPLFCRIFPVDKKDIELSGMKGLCAYYFG